MSAISPGMLSRPMRCSAIATPSRTRQRGSDASSCSQAMTVSGSSSALRQGVRLEWVTIAWMLVEAVIAVGAGIAARSVLLTAFGIDSVVELLSGIVVLRRLLGRAEEEISTRISAVLLVLLCVYVVLF